EKLIENEAKAKNIKISDSDITAAVKTVQDQLTAQGTTLADALKTQGMSMEEFRSRIILQKDLEKLVADKINVTDQEISQYIKDNKVTIPKGQEAAMNAEIKDLIKNDKVKTESQNLLTELKAKAKINY